MKFNHLIKEWRKEAGLTLEDLSRKTNFSVQAISLYENEKRNVSVETLKIFAKAFNKNIEFSVKELGNIIVSLEQRKKIEEIFFGEFDMQNQYDKFKELFDIKSEEIRVGKLYDDMDEKEYIKYSPSTTRLNKDNMLFNKNLHLEEVLLYYACSGGEVELNEDGSFKSVSVNGNVPVFLPPKRTSKDGFITEQRRELLKLLIDCFKLRNNKPFSFDIKTFRKRIGF